MQGAACDALHRTTCLPAAAQYVSLHFFRDTVAEISITAGRSLCAALQYAPSLLSSRVLPALMVAVLCSDHGPLSSDPGLKRWWLTVHSRSF